MKRTGTWLSLYYVWGLLFTFGVLLGIGWWMLKGIVRVFMR